MSKGKKKKKKEVGAIIGTTATRRPTQVLPPR